MLPNFDTYSLGLREKYLNTTILPAFEFEVRRACKVFSDRLETYKLVEGLCQVPKELIFCLHYRECNLDFSRQLLNGEHFNQETTLVPKGLGPWPSWEVSTRDAMNLTKLSSVKNWNLELLLFYAERHNGFGYYHKSVPSPYLWSGTDQYTSGKYVADGSYDPSKVDQQAGVVALLKGLESTNMNRFKPTPPKPIEVQPEPVKEEMGKVLPWLKNIFRS
jgi:lysozyme family protein